MLYILPLEPLEERYTIQWNRWFSERMDARQIPYDYIYGIQLSDTVETGSVLDAEGTNYWKLSQLMTVCEMFKTGQVKPGDKFFAFDMWFPGLEAIPYMAELEHIPIEIYAFLHAGSYTTEDFAEPMVQWARWFERGWVEFCTKIFAGTQYHANKFKARRFHSTSKKVVVTGNPFNSKDVLSLVPEIKPVVERENIIIFPHRWDSEKRPDVFMHLMTELWRQRKDFKVVITTSRSKFRSNDPSLIPQLRACEFPYEVKAGLTKAQYYQELAKAKIFVSTTIEENFGYCLLEAITLGCDVVVPNKYSHPEILSQEESAEFECLYDDSLHALTMLSNRLKFPYSRTANYDDSIDKILTEIGY